MERADIEKNREQQKIESQQLVKWQTLLNETEGFNNTKFGELKHEVEILSIIDEIQKEIQDTQLEQTKKDLISEKLSKLKDRLEI